jgi:hypothetical protein
MKLTRIIASSVLAAGFAVAALAQISQPQD